MSLLDRYSFADDTTQTTPSLLDRYDFQSDKKEPPAALKLAGKAVGPLMGFVALVKTGAASQFLRKTAESIPPATGEAGTFKIGPRALAQAVHRPTRIPERHREPREILEQYRRQESAKGTERVGVVGENIGKGLMRLPLAVAAWKVDLVTRPKVAISDMGQFLKEGYYSWKDVWHAIEGDEETKARSKAELETMPVETVVTLFGPIGALLGVKSIAKFGARKVVQRAATKEAAKQAEAASLLIDEAIKKGNKERALREEAKYGISVEGFAKKIREVRAEKAKIEEASRAKMGREKGREVLPEERVKPKEGQETLEQMQVGTGTEARPGLGAKPPKEKAPQKAAKEKEVVERPPYEEYVDASREAVKEYDVRGEVKKGQQVLVQLPTHKKPHRAKIVDVLTDEAGNPSEVVVEWRIGRRRRVSKYKKIKETVTERAQLPISEINVPPARAGAAEYNKAFTVLPQELRGQARRDATAFDRLLERNSDTFISPEDMLAEYPEYVYGYGTKPGEIARGGLKSDLRERAAKVLGAKDFENPVERARYLGELEEYVRRESAPRGVEEVTPTEYLASGPRLWTSLGESLQQGLKRGRAKLGLGPRVKIEGEVPKPGITSYFRTPTNYLGAVPGQKPFDITAARAIRKLTELEVQAKIEEGLGIEYLNENVFKHLVKNPDVPRKGLPGFRKYDWSKLAEAIEKTPLEIEAMDLVPRTKEAIRNIKTWYEGNRKLLVDEMRSELSRYMSPDKVKKAVPDDWGVKEYLTHIFPGDFLLRVKRPNGKMEVVGSAHSKAEAMLKIGEDFASRGDVTSGDYSVVRKQVLATDPFRMASQRKARLIDDLTKASELSRDEIIAFLEGKKYKAKVRFDPMKERKGVPGYSTELPFILDMYNSWMARRRFASRMRQKVSPLIDKLEMTGRDDMANYVRETVNYTFGRQHPWSKALDNTLAKTPIIRDRVRSHTLERWTGKIKRMQRFFLLTASPKFHLLNRMQTFQTLLPIIDAKNTTFWSAQKGFSQEQLALLEKHNVRFIGGGKLEEAGKPITKAALRQKVASKTAGFGSAETFNQELSWLTMFEHGRQIGLTETNAAKYAFMRGNIYTQFAHLKSDVPPFFRNPVVTTLMPFRRFPIKTYELLWDISRPSVAGSKKAAISGVAKFLTMHLAIGGTRATTGFVGKVGTLGYLAFETLGNTEAKELKHAEGEGMRRAYNSLKDNTSEEFANMVFWGLPGLLGLDLSYSVQLVDRDYGASAAEEIVNEFAGPVISTAGAAMKAAASKKGPIKSPVQRAARAVVQKTAGLKWISALDKIVRNDMYFEAPDGEEKFKADLTSLLIEGMGGRPVEAGQVDLYVGAAYEMSEAYDDYLDRAVAELREGNHEACYKIVDEWNKMWPNAWMTVRDEVKPRLQRRLKDEHKLLPERVLDRLPQPLKEYFGEELTEE